MKLIFNLLIIIFITNQTLSADWERWRGPSGNGLWNGPQISQKLPKTGLKENLEDKNQSRVFRSYRL